MITRYIACALCALTAFLTGCAPAPVAEKTLRLYIRGAALFSEGKYQDCAALLSGKDDEAALNSFVPALTLRGKARYFLGEAERAEDDFNRVLKKEPGQTDALLYRARILREKADNAGALRLVERLLAADPYDARALRLASELTKTGGNDAVSLAYLDRAVEAGTESALALLERARRRWVSGRPDEALADVRGAKALTGKESALYRVIANLEKTISGGKSNE